MWRFHYVCQLKLLFEWSNSVPVEIWTYHWFCLSAFFVSNFILRVNLDARKPMINPNPDLLEDESSLTYKSLLS
jgi:hypothetical protein